MATKTIMMTGDGYYEDPNLDPVPNTPNKYTLIDDPVGSPDDYTTFLMNFDGGTADTEIITFTFADIDIPDGNHIDSLTIHIRASKSDPSGTPPTLKIALLLSGTLYYSAEVTPLTTSLGNFSVTFPTNPATGGAWTESQINASEIGAVLSVPGNKNHLNVTQLYAVVSYTEGSLSMSHSGAILLCL